MDKKNVAIYIRVSSDEQKKEGLSVEAQLRKLQQYCEFKDWVVFKVYTDEGISAKSIKGRPAFSQMLQETKNGKFSAILITKFDRAFRNVKEALITFDDLKEKGVDFVSISEDIDTTTAMGKFFFIIISALAQFEREMTSDRNKAILEDKFNRGIIIGKIPFGYNAVYKNKKEKKGIIKIVIHPKESEIVKQVFQKTSEGISYKEICKEFKLKPQSYYNMIKNKVYMGIVSFEGIQKTGSHEGIISEELWRKVNAS